VKRTNTRSLALARHSSSSPGGWRGAQADGSAPVNADILAAALLEGACALGGDDTEGLGPAKLAQHTARRAGTRSDAVSQRGRRRRLGSCVCVWC
jgi:hypothetical protein